MATDGSHGNLGDRDVDAGDTVVVPRRIGEFRTTLLPIPHSDQEAHPGKDAPGGLGVVLVLMEENLVSDAGARAGYAALVEFVRNVINNDIIPKLYLGDQEVEDKEINDRVDEAIGTIEDAIKHVQGAGENFWSWVDKDRTIGFRVLRVTQDALADNYWDINECLLRVRQDNGAVVDNWQVTGSRKVPGRAPTTTPTRVAPRISAPCPRPPPRQPACIPQLGCRTSSTATPTGTCTSCGATPSARSARPI